MALDHTLEEARSTDEPLVIGFLEAARLPTEGLRDQFPQNYVVARRRGELIGVAGLEVYADVGLLRSVAVAEGARGRGLGRSLVDNRLEFARSSRVNRVFLLTMSAERYFTSLGFAPVNRAEAPSALAASPEFASACPASASCLLFTF
jgi:amino-acid N-acetyltransferase